MKVVRVARMRTMYKVGLYAQGFLFWDYKPRADLSRLVKCKERLYTSGVLSINMSAFDNRDNSTQYLISGTASEIRVVDSTIEDIRLLWQGLLNQLLKGVVSDPSRSTLDEVDECRGLRNLN